MGWLGCFTVPAWDTETWLLGGCLLPGPCTRPSGVTGLRCSWKPCPELGPCSRDSLALLFLPELCQCFSAWCSRLVESQEAAAARLARERPGHYFCLLLCPIDFQPGNSHGSERSGGGSQNLHGCGTPGSRWGRKFLKQTQEERVALLEGFPCSGSCVLIRSNFLNEPHRAARRKEERHN